jgi:hypothetical protein
LLMVAPSPEINSSLKSADFLGVLLWSCAWCRVHVMFRCSSEETGTTNSATSEKRTSAFTRMKHDGSKQRQHERSL